MGVVPFRSPALRLCVARTCGANQPTRPGLFASPVSLSAGVQIGACCASGSVKLSAIWSTLGGHATRCGNADNSIRERCYASSETVLGVACFRARRQPHRARAIPQPDSARATTQACRARARTESRPAGTRARADCAGADAQPNPANADPRPHARADSTAPARHRADADSADAGADLTRSVASGATDRRDDCRLRRDESIVRYERQDQPADNSVCASRTRG